jgi:hypothetical protein
LAVRIDQNHAYFPRLGERANSGGDQSRADVKDRPCSCSMSPRRDLAPVLVERIGEILAKIQKGAGLAVLLAEQNTTWALLLATAACACQATRPSFSTMRTCAWPSRR